MKIFHHLDLNYEQCEIDGEEDPKEKEIIVDDSDDDQKFYSIHNLSSIYFHKFFKFEEPFYFLNLPS